MIFFSGQGPSPSTTPRSLGASPLSEILNTPLQSTDAAIWLLYK